MTIIQPTGVPHTISKIDPPTDSELLKIAQDVLHGLQYSFLAAAAS